MTLTVRRVVTGHDPRGRAVVTIDEVCRNVVSNRPGSSSCVVWSTEGFPVDNDGETDPTTRRIGTTIDEGTVFRVVRYEPGLTPRMHRTDSIDYAVVLSGQIDLQLDDGQTVSLKPGDLIVQRGTIHAWVNHGPEPCEIAFVLVAAKPVTVDGTTLKAEG
jgi:quercetin dioxygenase-like cupin family protein